MKLYSKLEILQLIKNFVQKNKSPVVEILGPTASGKTGFSLEVAHTFVPAEIISVDSRQIFRDIDISSAKIMSEEMQGISHWGLDLVDPDEDFSVYDFQKYAFSKIDEIHTRGALPILCGGTMLWLDAVSENYIFGPKGEKSAKKASPCYPVLKIGIHWDRKVLYERINQRSKQMFEEGLIEETEQILKKYPKMSRSAFTSYGYKEIQEYLEGEISLAEALECNQKRNRNYAKRQLTWWRGREDVLWINGEDLKS